MPSHGKYNDTDEVYMDTGTHLFYYRTSIGIATGIAGTEDWFKYLHRAKRFYCHAFPRSFTARKEKKRNSFYWYAYVKINDRVYKKYLGADSKLTIEKLQSTSYLLDDKFYND